MVEISDELRVLYGIPDDATPEDVQDAVALNEAAFSGPAPFANRFLVSGHGGVVRLHFADQNGVGTDPQYRAAVAMTAYNAAELVVVLRRYLAEHIEQARGADAAPE